MDRDLVQMEYTRRGRDLLGPIVSCPTDAAAPNERRRCGLLRFQPDSGRGGGNTPHASGGVIATRAGAPSGQWVPDHHAISSNDHARPYPAPSFDPVPVPGSQSYRRAIW